MSPLHRTQVLLDAEQYERLRRQAAEERTSLSAMLRRILDRALRTEEPPPSKEALRRIRGIVADGRMGPKDHDRILYSTQG